MNVIALVGRPNVGKSTLFNRLIGKKDAIIEDTPGVTRDRNYGYSDWNGKKFMVIDTGGFIPGSENIIERAIREQAYLAIDESDVIVFICDAKEGITPYDIDIARILRNSNKPVVLVINKSDNEKTDANAFEFYKLGLGDPFPISALNGRGTGDFLDEVTSKLLNDNELPNQDKLKIAIVGRPNAGKSSLVNSLLGKNRSIVTEIPGTTRDSIDSIMKYYGEEIVLIDTAGLRKRSKIKESIEYYSTLRTVTAIERSDITVVLIDSQRGLEEQDKKIINQVTDAKKGIIVAFNKWDIIQKDNNTAEKFKRQFYEEMKTHSYVPLLFISAKTKQRITKIIDLAKEIEQRRNLRISTAELNRVLLPILEKTPPPAVKGKDLRINYITQVSTKPPLFAFFSNYPHLMPDSYKRFIENNLRNEFDFIGTPISFVFKKKNVKWSDRVL